MRLLRPLLGVEHFGGPRVREHFPIRRLMPLIEKTL
jgi:hypothetical protein